MGRRPNEIDGLRERAAEDIRTAIDAARLRQAQAALLPLLGLTLDQTAAIIGRDRWWTSRARNQYLRGEPPPAHGGRRRAQLTFDEELGLVKLAIRDLLGSHYRHRSVRAALRQRLDRRSEEPVAESTISDLLSRTASKIVPGASAADLEDAAWALATLWRLEDRIAQRDPR